MTALGEELPEPIGTGLNRVEVHAFTDPRTGTRVRLEQPVHPATWCPHTDPLRHRGVAYDRLSGDLIPSLVPEGYLGIVDTDGQDVLLTETAVGLPQPYGECGWVYCHRTANGLVRVSAREHTEARPVDWGVSTRSLLGLRSRASGRTRLWSLGRHTIWLRREHRAPDALVRRSTQDGPWPDAVAQDLYRAAVCTVMMDDVPLPGLPVGAVAGLEVQDALILSIASTIQDLAAYLREDHINHYVILAAPEGQAPEASLVGDLPRGSVAHKDTGRGRAVIYTERLEDRTTSYAVEDGAIIATLDEPVSHYTGVPGLNGAWVEVRHPDTVRWPGGSWSDSSAVEGLRPGETPERVRVMTGLSRGYKYLTTGATASEACIESSDSVPAEPPAAHDNGGARSPGKALWAPLAADPVAGIAVSVINRSKEAHHIEIIVGDSTRDAAPLIWFDSSWTVPSMPSHRTRVDLGAMPVGSAQWTHASSRPVVRVGIDYEALAHCDTDSILAVLRDSWRSAREAIATMTAAPGVPFLGGHSFGAALAAVAVLHQVADPAGVILRSGAYDRYATPVGFEHDRRTVATDPDLYCLMTVVLHARAHQGIPFLLTCGDCDENSATTPRQSQVLYDNLAAWGADVTLAVVPGEGHEFSSRQAVLQLRLLEQEWMSQRCGTGDARERTAPKIQESTIR